MSDGATTEQGEGARAVETGGEMHIHKPKAPHGLREFLSEISVVVVGIVIALSFEGLLEAYRNHEMSSAARESVREEIGKNLYMLKLRMDSQPCLDRKLQDLGELLGRSGEGPLQPQPTWVSRPQFWSMASGAWQAATSGGRTVLLGQTEQIRLGYVYARFDLANREQEREQEAWAELRGLETWKGPLGPAARFGFAQSLQRARYASYRVRSISLSLLEIGKAEGIKPIERPLEHSNGICLPLTETRANALRTDRAPTGDPE
ncbi:hypothetical protein [Phenylobacterium montanum]|uniref:Uncharacterized protein n=1 Tax=Phenylobacterium montanum TaxID=2823693 RepID=A0A975G0B5_9CAUL|nr:hypothetical protein [Caulobacter sp. S6]QUD88137.1 hypothetical protein KCG34_24430 [Caulobacter sp. S6]